MKYEYKSEAKLRQQMFNNRLKIKYVCHECGHVHYNSALTMLVHSILCISIFCIVGTSAVIFVDNVLVVAALDEFLDVDEITDTKLEQANTMVSRFSHNTDLSTYTMFVLAKAKLEANITKEWELSEIEKIYYLHQAVIEDTIYFSDHRIGNSLDVLYSPLITLHHGGDCEDRAVLFLTLAKISNLDCKPVITNSHFLAYCIYDEDKMVFVDSSNTELGLKSNLVSERLILY